MSISPVRVGVCLDFPLMNLRDDFLDTLRLVFDEALEQGIIDRPVDLEIREVEGLPRGTSFAVLQGWRELAAAGCLCILGPLISDNTVSIRDHVEREGGVPTLTWSGTDRWFGEWCFGISNGSLSEEPYVMANFLANEGVRSVGAVYDHSVPGNEYLAFFRDACDREGLEIVHAERVSQVQQDLEPAVRRLHAKHPEALAYFGFGLPALRINAALLTIGWNPLRVMTTAFLIGYLVPEFMRGLKGWVGVDQYDEENGTLRDFLDRFEKRFGRRPAHFLTAVTHDSARLLAHGIGKASPLSPAGVKEGLERVKMLPAASGGADTRLSFGPWIRRAWLGSGYLVLREVNADGTGTVLRARVRHNRVPA